jgi:hypothetical protein
MTWDDRPDEDVWFSVDPKGRREDDEPLHGRRGPSFLSVLLGLVAVAIAVVAWVNHSSQRNAAPKPSPTTSSPTTPTQSESTSSSTSSVPTPTVTTLADGRAPLGPTSPWDVFVLTTSRLLRIEMATGVIVRVELPVAGPEQSPVSVVDLGRSVLLQPLYEGTGWVVADDGSTTASAGRFPSPALIVPAIGSRRLWLSRGSQQVNRLDLLGPDGKVVEGASVALPADLYADSARSDGGLALLVDGIDGTYRVEAGRLRRITTGQLLGRSSEGWLVQECDEDHRCRLAFVDRGNGSRRAVGDPLDNPAIGSISPDGRRALVVQYLQDRAAAVLVDLRTGSRRPVAGVGSSPTGGATSTVWSPDSRWAVTTTDAGTVVGIDTLTGQVVELPVVDDGQVMSVAARYR